MAKPDSSSRCFARIFRSCLLVAVIGPICLTTATTPVVQSVTPISDFGDCPVWCEKTQSVFFIDGPRKTINRYQPDNNEFVQVKIKTEDTLKFIVPLSEYEASALVGYVGILGNIMWDGKTTDEITPALFTVIATATGEVLCSGKADSSERLWVGTSYPVTDQPGAEIKGRLYVMDEAGNATVILDNIGVPTGLAWNPDNTKFYYVNSCASTIVCHSYSTAEGKLMDEGNMFFDFAAQNVTGVPNGMTVDIEGNLWVACMKSSHVVKIDPNGTKVMEVDLPTACGITNVAFGGPNLTDLYVTTAADPTKPESGALFRVTDTGATGILPNGTIAKIVTNNVVIDDGVNLSHSQEEDTGYQPQVMTITDTGAQ